MFLSLNYIYHFANPTQDRFLSPEGHTLRKILKKKTLDLGEIAFLEHVQSYLY